MVRIFAGKKYELHGSYSKKADAEKAGFQCAIGRAGPCKIRKESGYWVVYRRVVRK